MDIIRKKSRWKILEKPVSWLAISMLFTLAIFPLAIYNQSKAPKKNQSIGSQFVFHPNQAQIFQVQLTDNMLVEYKLTPRFDFEGKIQYSTDLTLFYWNSEFDRYTPYPTMVPPQEIINELNKLPAKKFTHEIE
jgi:hypothetical protein